MKKLISNLGGKELSKNEQKNVNGGIVACKLGTVHPTAVCCFPTDCPSGYNFCDAPVGSTGRCHCTN